MGQSPTEVLILFIEIRVGGEGLEYREISSGVTPGRPYSGVEIGNVQVGLEESIV